MSSGGRRDCEVFGDRLKRRQSLWSADSERPPELLVRTADPTKPHSLGAHPTGVRRCRLEGVFGGVAGALFYPSGEGIAGELRGEIGEEATGFVLGDLEVVGSGDTVELMEVVGQHAEVDEPL